MGHSSIPWETCAHVRPNASRLFPWPVYFEATSLTCTTKPCVQTVCGFMHITDGCDLMRFCTLVSSPRAPPRKRQRMSSPTYDVQMEDLSQEDIDGLEEIEFRLSQAGTSSSQAAPFPGGSSRTQSESPPVCIHPHICAFN